jgi:hypothetical protein
MNRTKRKYPNDKQGKKKATRSSHRAFPSFTPMLGDIQAADQNTMERKLLCAPLLPHMPTYATQMYRKENPLLRLVLSPH